MAFRRSARGRRTLITVNGLSKRFGVLPALKGIDLDVRYGEFLALLGPSGSGKTTLLRIIAGLEFPDAGRVEFNGEDVTALKAADRKVGFVFQHYSLFSHLTDADNVPFGLRGPRPRQRTPNTNKLKSAVEAKTSSVQ